MYSLIIVGLISVGFALLFTDLADKYSLDYDNQSLETYNQLNDIQTQTEAIQGNVSSLEEKTGVLDVVGSWFSNGYKVLLLTKGSYDTFDTMSNKAIDEANLGVFGSYLKIAIGGMILIMIFIGVIMSALIKRYL